MGGKDRIDAPMNELGCCNVWFRKQLFNAFDKKTER